MKINKKIFFVLTLLTLILLVSTVNATDNTTTTADDTQVVTDTSSDTMVSTQEEIQTSMDNNIKTKKLEKEDKYIKDSTKTVEVNNYNELTSAINDAVNDADNDEYIINLNEGTYTITQSTNLPNGTQNNKNIIINGNNQILTGTNKFYTNFDNSCNITINDFTFNNRLLNNYNLTLNSVKHDSSYKYGITNTGLLIVNNNSRLNCTVINKENSTMIISEDTTIGECTNFINNGTILTNNTKILELLGIDTETPIIENTTIGSQRTITKNTTFINCNITAQITNYANLTLVNCSLSNNTMNVSQNGCLLNNRGNATLIDCVMANNTLNSSAMVNDGFMTILNTYFENNKAGYVNITSGLLHANVVGNGAIVNNNATLVIDNSTFKNGYAGGCGGAILNKGNLTVNNSLFNNNTVNTAGSAIYNIKGNFTINNTIFSENYVNLSYNNISLSGGGAIADEGEWTTAKGIIYNCTFENNRGEYTGNIELAGVSGAGGALLIGGTTYNITNSTFKNNNISNGKPYNVYPSNTSINNCTFENSEILDRSGLDIINNTFKQNSGISKFIDDSYPNKKITGNNFTNNNITTYYDGLNQAPNTISFIHTDPNRTKEEILNYINITVEKNTYQNTSINDKITLNVPENIYIGEPITIIGTYELLEPENYDSDILEQNKFNIYINEELVDTVDTLEFTITPTSSNMILTVQPTISQTRKSAIIRASTLNITLEPITATIGETTQLTAQITFITDDTEMEVNTGRVYFKVNGKILRDTSNGRILYADVSDNTATLDYLVPKTWNEDTEIEAVFTGNDDLPQKVSNTVNPTITALETQEMEFIVTDVTSTAGDEITITVTTKNLDAGKVVLKVNGKTVKADDGKLYTKVSGDSVTFTYTVPKTLKAGDYTIKAVYTSGATRLEADAMLTVG